MKESKAFVEANSSMVTKTDLLKRTEMFLEYSDLKNKTSNQKEQLREIEETILKLTDFTRECFVNGELLNTCGKPIHHSTYRVETNADSILDTCDRLLASLEMHKFVADRNEKLYSVKFKVSELTKRAMSVKMAVVDELI